VPLPEDAFEPSSAFCLEITAAMSIGGNAVLQDWLVSRGPSPALLNRIDYPDNWIDFLAD
jgi:hypothetical protein